MKYLAKIGAFVTTIGMVSAGYTFQRLRTVAENLTENISSSGMYTVADLENLRDWLAIFISVALIGALLTLPHALKQPFRTRENKEKGVRSMTDGDQFWAAARGVFINEVKKYDYTFSPVVGILLLVVTILAGFFFFAMSIFNF